VSPGKIIKVRNPKIPIKYTFPDNGEISNEEDIDNALSSMQLNKRLDFQF
jgi:hypothetical protein